MQHFFMPFLCVMMLAACGTEGADKYSKYKNHPAQALVGEAVPDLTLQNLVGDAESLPNFDVPTVINVWATWCPPCVKELPSLMELDASDDFNVLAISTDKQPHVVREFLDKEGLEGLDVSLDAMGRETRAKLNANGLPISYLVDTDGVVRRVDVGEREWAHPEMIEVLQNSLMKGTSS